MPRQAFEAVHLRDSDTAGPNIPLIQNVECTVRLHERLRLLPGSDLDSPTHQCGVFVEQGGRLWGSTQVDKVPLMKQSVT